MVSHFSFFLMFVCTSEVAHNAASIVLLHHGGVKQRNQFYVNFTLIFLAACNAFKCQLFPMCDLPSLHKQLKFLSTSKCMSHHCAWLLGVDVEGLDDLNRIIFGIIASKG